MTRTRPLSAAAATDDVDSSYLHSLIGYNASRVSLVVVTEFLKRLAPYDLRPVPFSALSLITHNPGITARQLASVLKMKQPNLVGIIGSFETRKLIRRKPHPSDGRAAGLHPTAAGRKLMREAESLASEIEKELISGLSASERRTLIDLMKKIYL